MQKTISKNMRKETVPKVEQFDSPLVPPCNDAMFQYR